MTQAEYFESGAYDADMADLEEEQRAIAEAAEVEADTCIPEEN